MRMFLSLIIVSLLSSGTAAAGQDCSLSHYKLSEDGVFQLPEACDGYLNVNFDSETDLRKLKYLDHSAHSSLISVLETLSVEESKNHKELLLEAGAHYTELGGLTLYTSDPPQKQYRFSIRKFVFKGSVRLNSEQISAKKVQ